jgi:2-methylcitrate dehydratase PrpD
LAGEPSTGSSDGRRKHKIGATMTDALAAKSPDGPQTLSGALAAFVANSELSQIPREVIRRSKDLIVDTLGVAYAALQDPFAKSVLTAGRALGPDGCSTVVGSAACLRPREAALVNGALMHGLDYDDTHIKAMMHSSVVSLPTALAIAEDRKLSGQELLATFVVASEAAIRLGLAAAGLLPTAGFHATGVIGHFASALAAGRLMRLSERELIAAQGVAGSTAAGILAYLDDGTWTKRLHPGWAAVGGISAAELAKAGFLGPSRVYEGRFGFFETHLGNNAAAAKTASAMEALGQKWHVLDVSPKPYPICHLTHGCAEAAIEIARRNDIQVADISEVTALVPAQAMSLVAEPLEQKRRPSSEYEAMFSAPYAVAVGLARRRFGMLDLTKQALGDPEVAALCVKVRCEPDPQSGFPEFCSGGVVVRTRDGRELAGHVRVNAGAGDRAFSAAEIKEKFKNSSAAALSDAHSERIYEAVMSLESIQARELGVALRS